MIDQTLESGASAPESSSHSDGSEASENQSGTIVEATMRAQRGYWQEIFNRVAGLESRDFPHGGPKRIIFFGLGSSFIAAKLCQLTLKRDRSRPRVPVIACPSTHVGVDAIPAKGDWVFAFTHRASAGPTMDAMALADRMGAFTVQVSAIGIEQSAHARYLLPTVPPEKVEPHTAAVTGAICAVTSLLLGNKAVEEWDALTSIPAPSLEMMKRKAGMGPTIVLGEWEGEWLAKEGALKLIEMSRIPVRSYGSEEYFHGPHFSQTEKDVIWHVALPKDPRDSTIKAAHQVGVFGSSPLAWMPALLELQWLALATALNRGVNPDLGLRE
jgi:fructoselysine-6-P-deglycase FrlB-like protein